MRPSAGKAAESSQTEPTQEAYIKERYGKEPNEEIASHLGISKLELQNLARKFGLRVKVGSGMAYTPEEDEYIKEHYGKKMIIEIGEALGRTRDSIGSRVDQLGLRQGKRYSNLAKATSDSIADPHDYCRRRNLLLTYFRRLTEPRSPEQHMALAVVLQAVKDIGTTHDAVPAMVSGGLDYWYESLGIDAEDALAALKRSGLITEQHKKRMRDLLIGRNRYRLDRC